MIQDNGGTIRPGDIIKLQPRDPYFAMLISPMMMVEKIINDQTLVTVDGNIVDLSTFHVIYINGKELDKYPLPDEGTYKGD